MSGAVAGATKKTLGFCCCCRCFCYCFCYFCCFCCFFYFCCFCSFCCFCGCFCRCFCYFCCFCCCCAILPRSSSCFPLLLKITIMHALCAHVDPTGTHEHFCAVPTACVGAMCLRARVLFRWLKTRRGDLHMMMSTSITLAGSAEGTRA